LEGKVRLCEDITNIIIKEIQPTEEEGKEGSFIIVVNKKEWELVSLSKKIKREDWINAIKEAQERNGPAIEQVKPILDEMNILKNKNLSLSEPPNDKGEKINTGSWSRKTSAKEISNYINKHEESSPVIKPLSLSLSLNDIPTEKKKTGSPSSAPE